MNTTLKRAGKAATAALAVGLAIGQFGHFVPGPWRGWTPVGTGGAEVAGLQVSGATVPSSSRRDVNLQAVPGELVIKFVPGTPGAERQRTVQAQGGRLARRIAALDVDVAEFPAMRGASRTTQVIEALKNNPNVEYAEPNAIYRAIAVPNDPAWTQQTAFQTVEVAAAWDVTRGTAGTVVSIVDTGVQLDHPDLASPGASRFVEGTDVVTGDGNPTDENGHGTHVAGTAGALTNNAIGGAGMCPECGLMAVRVLDAAGNGTLDGVANGITWAADRGAKVINLSLGGGGTLTLENAVNYAWSKGAFLACAAGNDGVQYTTNSYPAAYENCFAVASTDAPAGTQEMKSSFSNYGGWVEAAAPGRDIYSTSPGSGYQTLSGTSMATPHVAGLAGLLASLGRDVPLVDVSGAPLIGPTGQRTYPTTNAGIKDLLCNTADGEEVNIVGTGSYAGALWYCGRINARRALNGIVRTAPRAGTGIGIVNGSFEEGPNRWLQQSNGGWQLVTGDRPHNPGPVSKLSAYLGGANFARDTIEQEFIVPTDGNVILHYWWFLDSQETRAGRDRVTVELVIPGDPAAGTTTKTVVVARHDDPRLKGQWREQKGFSLAQYAGKTVRLRFSIVNDATRPTSFFVDNVKLATS